MFLHFSYDHKKKKELRINLRINLLIELEIIIKSIQCKRTKIKTILLHIKSLQGNKLQFMKVP